jgi:hypothetical protein
VPADHRSLPVDRLHDSANTVPFESTLRLVSNPRIPWVSNIKKNGGCGSKWAFLFEESILIMHINAEDWHNKTGVGIP